jgi:hypothetical protein
MPMGQAQLGFQSSPTTRPSLIGQPISASRPKLKQGGLSDGGVGADQPNPTDRQ